MNKKYTKVIEEFIEETSAKKMIVAAPKKGGVCAFVLTTIFSVIFSLKLGIDYNTVELAKSFVEILINILLAIFGCIFAVYSILLAFLNDSYISKLAKIEEQNQISYLKNSTTYFESILFLYFIGLSLSGLLLLFLNCIEPDFTITNNHMLNNTLAILLLITYLAFIFRIFYELKSTIYNTIVLFRSSIAYKLLDYMKEEDSENDKDK